MYLHIIYIHKLSNKTEKCRYLFFDLIEELYINKIIALLYIFN